MSFNDLFVDRIFCEFNRAVGEFREKYLIEINRSRGNSDWTGAVLEFRAQAAQKCSIEIPNEQIKDGKLSAREIIELVEDKIFIEESEADFAPDWDLDIDTPETSDEISIAAKTLAGKRDDEIAATIPDPILAEFVERILDISRWEPKPHEIDNRSKELKKLEKDDE